MDRKQHFKMWLKIGVGRTSKIADVLGCSRQYVSKIGETGAFSDDKYSELSNAMKMIEELESWKHLAIKNNLRSISEMLFSPMPHYVQFATTELYKWTMHLYRLEEGKGK